MSGRAARRAPAAPEVGRRYRGVAEDERRAERRRRFVDAGIAVIGGRGFHAATVRALCAAAGLSERYFYESFTSREELLAAAFEHRVALVRARMLEAVAAAPRDPEAMVRAALGEFFAAVEEDPAAARLQLFEILGVSEAIDALYRRTTEEFAKLLRTLASDVLGELGRLPGDEAFLAIGLVGAVVHMAARWLLMRCADPRAVVVESCVSLFLAVNRQLGALGPATRPARARRRGRSQERP